MLALCYVQVSRCCWEREEPRHEDGDVRSDPQLRAELGHTPVWPQGWYDCCPRAGFYPLPLGKDVTAQWEASGSGCRALTGAGAAGPGPHWDLLGWVLVSAPGRAEPGGTCVSGWAPPEQHYPALFLHLHGDAQEAVQMEICKAER